MQSRRVVFQSAGQALYCDRCLRKQAVYHFAVRTEASVATIKIFTEITSTKTQALNVEWNCTPLQRLPASAYVINLSESTLRNTTEINLATLPIEIRTLCLHMYSQIKDYLNLSPEGPHCECVTPLDPTYNFTNILIIAHLNLILLSKFFIRQILFFSFNLLKVLS